MPEFHLDTSGAVDGVPAVRGHASGETLEVRYHGHIKWSYLDAFTQGYIEALFFTENSPGNTMEKVRRSKRAYEAMMEGGSIPEDAGFDDLAPATLAAIIADCAGFQAQMRETLESAYERGYSEEQAGRDLWFTRCGHGVGYWDRETLEPEGEEWEATEIPLDQWTPELRATRERLKAASPGQVLSEAARAFGNVDAYLGDDGKVHLS